MPGCRPSLFRAISWLPLGRAIVSMLRPSPSMMVIVALPSPPGMAYLISAEMVKGFGIITRLKISDVVEPTAWLKNCAVSGIGSPLLAFLRLINGEVGITKVGVVSMQ